MDHVNYVRGSIVRVTLRNFMTHSYCEFRPGPQLNLVIGSNGSGKSSILCGIALGLGGEPKDLGRSNQVQAYIKNGEDSATIEVELYESISGKRNNIIQRVINQGQNENSRGNSVWSWNGKTVSQKVIVDRLLEFGISVGNLCQVLPQDRVGDFSKFDPVKILEETVRACLGEKEVELRDEIYNLNNESSVLLKSLGAKNKELERHEVIIDKLKEKVTELQKRSKLEEELDILEKLRPWMDLKLEKADLVQRTSEFRARENELATVKSKLAEREQSVEIKVEALKDLKNSNKSLRQTLDRTETKMKTKIFKLSKRASEIDALFEQISHLNSEEKDIDVKIATYETNIEGIRILLKNFSNMDSMTELMSDINSRISPIEADINRIITSIELTERKKKENEFSLSKLRRKLEDIAGQKAQNRDIVNELCSDDVSRVYSHISKLVENKTFKKKVFGPMFLELSFENEQFAGYTETLLNFNFLFGYTSQTHEDLDILDRTKKLTCFNVEISPDRSNAELDKFKGFKKYPAVETLLGLGILGFGIEFVKASPEVLETLLRVTDIGSILFANEYFDSMFSDNAIKTIQKVLGVTNIIIYSPTTLYIAKRSRYSDDILINSSPYARRFKGNGGNSLLWRNQLGRPGFSSSDDQVKLQLQKITEENEILEAKIVSLKGEKASKERDLSPLTIEHSKLKSKNREFRVLMANLNTAEIDLQTALDSRNRDFKGEKQAIEESLKQLLKNSTSSISDVVTKTCTLLVEKGMLLSEEALRIGSSIYELQQCNDDLQFMRSEIKMNFQKLEVEERKLQIEKKKLVENEAKLNEEIPLDVYTEKFRNVKERNSIEEIEERINRLQEELRNMFADTSLSLEYENSLKMISTLKPELKDLSERFEKLQIALTEKRESFETHVKEKTDIIDRKYAEMFKLINDAGYKCQGRVEFKRDIAEGVKVSKYSTGNGDGGVETLRYGIGILVKFRESQKLELLNAEVQSGGERSLSTFLYLLALQSCSSAPFRIVDEINQGMDAQKERLAFNCLVSNSCEKDQPQYFLITPKLLPGLNFGKHAQINFVENSWFAPIQENSLLSKMIKSLNKLRNELPQRKSLDVESFASERENTPEMDGNIQDIPKKRKNEIVKLEKSRKSVVKKEKRLK